MYGRPEKADWRRYARFTVWGVLALFALLFILGNSQEVQVNFLFREATLPMYIALLITLVLGLLIGAGGVWFLGRRRAKSKAAAVKRGKK